jgi:hypothetical protein
MNNNIARAVVRVGDGRGFVVELCGDLVIITACHCLPHTPPAHPASYLEERTYKTLLGPLGSKPRVWAECLFADPIADIAVLGTPDTQDLYKEAEAYSRLVMSYDPLKIGDAPPPECKREILHTGSVLTYPEPSKNVPAWLLSLKGRRIKVELSVGLHGEWLEINPSKAVVPGMSGSPIVSTANEAIGLCSTGCMNPVLKACLPPRLFRPKFTILHPEDVVS